MIHTTSTKCQYQIVTFTCTLSRDLFERISQLNNILLPTRTWKPWNPVVTKKILPNTESARLYLSSKYSKVCTPRKLNPHASVRISHTFQCLFIPSKWCATVTLIPEVRSSNVFSRGMPQGLQVTTPIGGH